MVKRGIERSGLSSIGIGEVAIYKELVYSQHIGDARFDFNITTVSVLVTITKGNALFVDFEPIINGKVLKIEFKCQLGSSCRFLSKFDVYKIIKSFYTDILDNCFGKTCEKQNNYLFRYNEPRSKRYFPNLPERINRSEEYIRNLPDEPTDSELVDWANKVMINNYGYHAKDEFGFEMNEYAKAIITKFKRKLIP